MPQSCLAVILAAGEGTRMRSSTHKVLHKIAGLEMLCHVLDAVQQAGCDHIALIVGKKGQKIENTARAFAKDLDIFIQERPLGTAHAVLAAREALAEKPQDVLIVFGDTPLLEPQNLSRLRAALTQGADLAVSGFYPKNPTGYGRLIVEDGQLQAVVEEKDATDSQRDIKFCNGGVMAVRGVHVLTLLENVSNNNAAGEYYLPDIVAIAHAQQLQVRAVEIEAENVTGINTQAELAMAEDLWQQRKRQAIMAQGVTLIAPQTVYFCYDSEIAPGVIIEPHVIFGPKTQVKSGALIRAFSHIEGAIIGENAEIGPFARLRSGSNLQTGVKIGNFCEIKQANVAAGSKINHLSYIGNAEIGVGVNIGAGTITCNYDGTNKWQTTIDDGAFIGSNSALVAPLTIGKRAYIASGSVITQNVSADDLAFGRARQLNKPDGAKTIRRKNMGNS